MDLEKSKGEEILYSGIQTASSQNEFQKEADDMVVLVNMARRPTQSRTCEFERGKRCNRLGRGDQTGSSSDNFCNFHKHTRKKAYDDLGRGEQQRVIRIRLPVESRSISPHYRENTTQKLPSREDRNVERRPTRRKRKSLPQLGGPTRHQTGFHQRELSQQPLRFRTLSRRRLGFGNRLCKLSQRPLGFRTLNRQPLGFRTHTRKLNRRPFGFRKLNR